MNHTPLNYALWLLGRRDRSIGEIKKKLTEKNCEKKEVNEVIEFLTKNKFVDDERFAKNYIQNQLLIKPLGNYQLKLRLTRKFISEEIIDKSLSEIGLGEEEELAEKAARKWLRKHADNSIGVLVEGKSKEKLTRHLISRGFDWETVKKVVQKLLNC